MSRAQIIAEAGVNHDGSLERALELVDVAAAAGADAVKFQTFRPELLVSRHAPKAAYQRASGAADESQLAMLRRLALAEDDQRRLQRHCLDRGIEFLSTPFDAESLEFLCADLRLSRLKLGSGDLTNGPLLLAAARTGRPLILSTGMATLEEIEQALAVLAFGYTANGQPPGREAFKAAYASAGGREQLQNKVIVLHCTTEYPCPFEDVNLRAMDTLAAHFGLPVGLSDHSEGIVVAIGAVARGAQVIEKHFTLDKTLPGPDHKASLSPDELHELVQAIRRMETALGSAAKSPAACERANIAAARKSLVATAAIAAHEPFTVENLGVKRPGSGVSPMEYWDRLGRPADRDYAADEEIGA